MEPATEDSSRSTRSLHELFLDCAADFKNSEKRHRLLIILLSRIRHLLRVLTISYLLFLSVLCVALHWFAEANITLVFISFLPAIAWVIPLGALLLLSLPFSWRLALLQFLAAAAYVWFYMDFEIASPANTALGAKSLTVLSYNRGQHHNQSFEPFIDETQPDVIVLQEAFGRSQLFRNNPRFADFPFIRGVSEFVVASKYPIGEITIISTQDSKKPRHHAARFEIDFDGTPIAIYAVHQPTLRDTLGYYRHGSFLYGILGFPGTPWGEIRKKEDTFWSKRADNALKLAEAIASDELPTIAAGDFNMPDHGMIYRSFASRLNDAHEESGGGFGYTVPGRNSLTSFGPWLRLDYIFSSSAWKTISFVTEAKRTSQHRAIAATLSIDPKEALLAE